MKDKIYSFLYFKRASHLFKKIQFTFFLTQQYVYVNNVNFSASFGGLCSVLIFHLLSDADRSVHDECDVRQSKPALSRLLRAALRTLPISIQGL